MERPKIEEFFPGGTTLSQAMKKYEEAPELFSYAKACDRYIDYLWEKRVQLAKLSEWPEVKFKEPEIEIDHAKNQ